MSVSEFQILSRLGEGAYSSVYKVKRISDGNMYALKKVKLMNLSDKEKQNALNEVRYIASIRHQNIICYKEAFLDEQSNSLCIVMEFCDNGDLFQKITEFQKKKQLFPEQEIFHIFIQIVKGLNELHNLKILHRDLKSANVFLCKDGSVKLGDLNVSKVAKKGLLYTQTGTPYYASPEVWKDTPYESKSDIWSLGCVLYEMTTLKPPFRGEDMEALYKKVIRGQYPRISPHFSQDLANVIKSLLQVTPHMRPSCEKILNMPAILRHQKNTPFFEVDEVNKQLMQTIRIPKNLHYLTDRLPKPNYAPLKIKKSEQKKFVQTMSQYSDINNKEDQMNNEAYDNTPKLQLPSIGGKQGGNRHNHRQYQQNGYNGINKNSVVQEMKGEYKSHSVDQENSIQPLMINNKQAKNHRKSDNYQNIIQNQRGNSKHLQPLSLQKEEQLISRQQQQQQIKHKQILNLINRRDKSVERSDDMVDILDIHSMKGAQKENLKNPYGEKQILKNKKKPNQITQKYKIDKDDQLDMLLAKYPPTHSQNRQNVQKVLQKKNYRLNNIEASRSPDAIEIDNTYSRNRQKNYNSNNNKKSYDNRLPSLNQGSHHSSSGQQSLQPIGIQINNQDYSYNKMEKNLEDIKDIYKNKNKQSKKQNKSEKNVNKLQQINENVENQQNNRLINNSIDMGKKQEKEYLNRKNYQDNDKIEQISQGSKNIL